MSILDQVKSLIAEKHLTAAEMRKREEIAKAIKRKNPGMPMGKKMAIATAKAKEVAESWGSNRGFKRDEHEMEARTEREHLKSHPDYYKPHTVHIDGRPWKTFKNMGHAFNVSDKLFIKGVKAHVALAAVKEASEPRTDRQMYFHSQGWGGKQKPPPPKPVKDAPNYFDGMAARLAAIKAKNEGFIGDFLKGVENRTKEVKDTFVPPKKKPTPPTKPGVS